MVCAGSVENLPNRLYENDGEGNFRMIPHAGGAAGSKSGRGDAVVAADYDRDGFLDLFVTNGAGPAPFGYDGPHQLFHIPTTVHEFQCKPVQQIWMRRPFAL